MKIGLSALPQIQDLETAYNHFLSVRLSRELPMNLNQLALYGQWSRFDSRLGEILVSHLESTWKQINPIELRASFLKQPWPAVLGVLLEFTRICVKGKDDQDLFEAWKNTATCRIHPSSWEQFFIGKRRIGGRAMLEDVQFSLEEYKKWGYLSREILIHKGSGKVESSQSSPGISYSAATRFQILRELSESNPRITLSMYLGAIGGSISKRQAERDLLKAPFLCSIGHTKGRFFRKN